MRHKTPSRPPPLSSSSRTLVGVSPGSLQVWSGVGLPELRRSTTEPLPRLMAVACVCGGGGVRLMEHCCGTWHDCRRLSAGFERAEERVVCNNSQQQQQKPQLPGQSEFSASNAPPPSHPLSPARLAASTHSVTSPTPLPATEIPAFPERRTDAVSAVAAASTRARYSHRGVGWRAKGGGEGRGAVDTLGSHQPCVMSLSYRL